MPALNPVGPGPTLQLLAQEVSRRNGEFIPITPSSIGSSTTLISTALNQFFPVAIPQFYAHVYGTNLGQQGVDVLNRGVEVDALSWSPSTSTITFVAPGFPVQTTSGVYEFRRLNTRERTVEAINDGIGELDFACLRKVKDETLVGVNNQWRYTLPATQRWANILSVEIQTNLNFVDFPYVPAEQMGLVWRPEETYDTSGNLTWQIQFSSQVPIGYIIRVWGLAWYPDLSGETDILPISGRWARKALNWLYRWAQAMLFEWQWASMATGDAKRAHERHVGFLQMAKEEILEKMRSDTPGRIVTPLNQMRGPSWNDPSYLGSFTSGGITNAPYSPVP